MRPILHTILCSLIFAAAGHAGAEEVKLTPPKARQGYYLSLGLQGTGAMFQNREDDKAWIPTLYGSGGQFRFGETVTNWLDLGLAFDFAFGGDERYEVGLFGLGIEASVVSAKDLALHVLAGAGAASLLDAEDPDERGGPGGAVYGIGVSKDIFLSTRRYGSGGWSIAPSMYARYYPGMRWQAYSLWGGFEIRRWKGLPKNQLELPIDQAFD